MHLPCSSQTLSWVVIYFSHWAWSIRWDTCELRTQNSFRLFLWSQGHCKCWLGSYSTFHKASDPESWTYLIIWACLEYNYSIALTFVASRLSSLLWATKAWSIMQVLSRNSLRTHMTNCFGHCSQMITCWLSRVILEASLHHHLPIICHSNYHSYLFKSST